VSALLSQLRSCLEESTNPATTSLFTQNQQCS